MFFIIAIVPFIYAADGALIAESCSIDFSFSESYFAPGTYKIKGDLVNLRNQPSTKGDVV